MNKQTTALIIAATVTLAAAMTTTAHADHDTGIYIQTGKGNFTYESDAAYDTVWDCRSIDVKGTVTQKVIDGLQRIDGVEYEQEEGLESIKPYFYTRTGELARVKIPPVGSTTIIVSSILDEIPKTEWINGAQMYTQTQACSNNKIDYNSIAEYTSDQKKINKWIEAGGEITSQQENLECLCKYWDTNTVKHEYAYTITDMPKDREIPPDYNSIVRAGVEAGLNSWAKINDIKFTYTDSRLEADIMIQQQIGAAYSNTYGNAEVGCIHENAQCTIQLFTDINTGNEQTLINKRMIEWVIAHEFGHLIGLPHHIDEGHIMSTIHANNVRTYYEVRNINIPSITELTYEQGLLVYESTETDNEERDKERDEESTFCQRFPDTIHCNENKNNETDTIDYTNMTQLMEHKTTIEFIEFVGAIINVDPFFAGDYFEKVTDKIIELYFTDP